MQESITLLTSGTRGDVQPLLALGRGLQRQGHLVRLATHAHFRRLAEQAGLPLLELEGNPNALFNQPEYAGALSFDGRPLQTLRGTLRYLAAVRPIFEQMLQSAWNICQGSRAIIGGLPTGWAGQIAEALGRPWIWALQQPLGETQSFPGPLQPWMGQLDLPAPLRVLEPGLTAVRNRLSHRLIEQSLWRPWRNELLRWRRQHLGLPPFPAAGPFAVYRQQQMLTIYSFSEQLLPRPPDWPHYRQITGYWFNDPPDEYQPSAELRRFLAAGPPPVYLTLGSSALEAHPRVRRLLQELLALPGPRMILGAGLPLRELRHVPPHLFVLPDVPYHWLFPQLSLVVHHAGAGTTAEALRAALPCICIPIGADQFFWSQRIVELGCGLRLPFRQLSAIRLLQMLEQASSDATLRSRAMDLSTALAHEQGVERAVELISAQLSR